MVCTPLKCGSFVFWSCSSLTACMLMAQQYVGVPPTTSFRLPTGSVFATGCFPGTAVHFDARPFLLLLTRAETPTSPAPSRQPQSIWLPFAAISKTHVPSTVVACSHSFASATPCVQRQKRRDGQGAGELGAQSLVMSRRLAVLTAWHVEWVRGEAGKAEVIVARVDLVDTGLAEACWTLR